MRLSSILRAATSSLVKPFATNARLPGARPIKLDALSVDDFDRTDPGRAADIDMFSSDPPAETGTPVLVPTETLRAPTVPIPTSPQFLYRNILLITSNPPFSIRRVIDYYFDWPKALHSAKSFNLLIGLALRSASFASVHRLFDAMRTESIQGNMETWKLQVRWFVRSGRWNCAWRRVLEFASQTDRAAMSPVTSIPLPLWLELFGSQKRGALRHWVLAYQKPDKAADWSPALEVVSKAEFNAGPGPKDDLKACSSSAPLFRKRLVPRPRPNAIRLSQYRALIRVSPFLVASPDQVQILPRTILIITRAMHQVGQRSLAISTALSYLESLPPRLRRCDRRGILDLVNCHISESTRHVKPGLKQHFARRRILCKFLHARRDLTPSPMTLFLILGSLRGCRRSGTLAMQCLRLFERRWGPRVQSRFVRRRVASLALKEGRLDIVETMIKLDRRCRVPSDTFPRTIYTSKRRPWRTLFSQRGAENRRWHSLEEKYRRRLVSRSES